MKYIITFGSNHLPELSRKLNPMKVMIVIEGEDMKSSRKHILDSFIGNKFSFQYPYVEANKMKNEYDMKEYMLEDIVKLKEYQDVEDMYRTMSTDLAKRIKLLNEGTEKYLAIATHRRIMKLVKIIVREGEDYAEKL